MKTLLMAVAGLFMLGASLGFGPGTDSATLSEQRTVERSPDPRYLPVLKPSPRNISTPFRGKGVILSIDLKSSAIDVSGTWVHVSSKTSINATVAMMMTIENLVVGTQVQVYGSRNEDGSINASRIDLLP